MTDIKLACKVQKLLQKKVYFWVIWIWKGVQILYPQMVNPGCQGHCTSAMLPTTGSGSGANCKCTESLKWDSKDFLSVCSRFVPYIQAGQKKNCSIENTYKIFDNEKFDITIPQSATAKNFGCFVQTDCIHCFMLFRLNLQRKLIWRLLFSWMNI